ncbi:folate family ECF transporter S component [Spiroplasma chinense]|uniref:Folate family ECF transporter S component n=1 Tax=Spiroplasma chinense TaxID=216932 RepID=A0A5B9Y2N5_9MOLU|nr:folate family ECF transporter S component [Spiroplasma chinense]QEH61298.1 folate family ECF transporter S component [Spiroplasma chinense]
MNWYLITNIIGATGVALILVIALAMEGFTFKKISLKHITLISMFGAVSVILTNFIGYSIPIFGNVRLAFGDWIIFLLGSLFGPLCGVVSAISIDSLGSVIPNSYGYHVGYMFGKTLLGLFGSFVFITKSQNRIVLKVILYYSLAYIIQSLFLNQIWMMSWAGPAAWVDTIAKIIKLPIALPIYISFTYGSLKVIQPLLDRWPSESVWCFRTTKWASRKNVNM